MSRVRLLYYFCLVKEYKFLVDDYIDAWKQFCDVLVRNPNLLCYVLDGLWCYLSEKRFHQAILVR